MITFQQYDLIGLIILCVFFVIAWLIGSRNGRAP